MKASVVNSLLMIVILGLPALNGCARYGIPLYDSPDHERFTERMDMPAKVLAGKLERYLKNERLLNRIVPDQRWKQTYYEGPWVRDFSGRYYYLHWDQRGRHRVQWKMVWRIRELGKNTSELSAEVMEILFWGPAEETPARPVPESGNWVQTPPDGYRMAREFAKFLGTILPRQSSLVRRYEAYSSPDLAFKPKADRLRTTKDPAIFSGPYFF
jgi:hypothetical protein